MALRSQMHLATPIQWLRLYKAQVEPNLILVAEASFDCTADLLNQMTGVQTQFARFILGLHSRSMKSLLLADFELIPIQHRRLQLTSRYYQYVQNNPSHLVWAALEDSKRLSNQSSAHNIAAKHRGWYYHFVKAVSCFIGVDVQSNSLPAELLASIVASEDAKLNTMTLTTPRLLNFVGYTLHTCLQPYLHLPRGLALYVKILYPLSECRENAQAEDTNPSYGNFLSILSIRS